MSEAVATPPPAPVRRGRLPLLARLMGVALAAFGWWLSLDLLRMTGGARSANPLIQAACGDQAEGDCLSVLRSTWAFASGAGGSTGMPWAALGAGYFAFLAVWYVFVGPTSRRAWAWHLIPVLVVVGGLVVSAALMQVMAVELRRWCAGCIAVHATNAALALLTLLAAPWRGKHNAPAHPSSGLALATLLAGVGVLQAHLAWTQLALTGNALAQMERAYAQIVQDPEFALWHWSRLPQMTIAIDAADATTGPADAPHTLVAFVDFQCPACRLAHARIAEVLAQHPGKLRVVFKYFPLNRNCNPSVAGSTHPFACAAALAAEASLEIGGPAARERLSGLMFERQQALTDAVLADWAVEIGLDRAAFERALAAPAVVGRVARSLEAATAAGVQNAPVLFLDGRRFDHWRNAPAWEKILSR